jgi:ATP-dependent DNA helicase RecG
VIDEQHRFGVHQRMALKEKGVNGSIQPHQLIMTATPIPRTLAMSAYADLDVSIIDELPPGRQPITTLLLANTRRAELIERIRGYCHAGKQVYWVCTLIEDSELLRAEAAHVVWENLKKELPQITIALVHGRMKAEEKEAVMTQFKNGKINLLVATTVIEVGVDVPNATVMIIENAERLGLAQLHQLRGRVGRGEAQSFCVLLYQAPISKTAERRLKVLRDSQDGFYIAEQDLQIRGPGEVLGTKQTGLIRLKVADLLRDQHLLPRVKNISEHIVQHEPHLIQPLLDRWLKGCEQYAEV